LNSNFNDKNLLNNESSIENVLIAVNKVQSKPCGGVLVKNCDLVVTDKRIVLLFTGFSSFTAAMTGNVFGGIGGSVAASAGADSLSQKKGSEYEMMGLEAAINSNMENKEIKISDITGGYFKTGFLSGLGLWSPLKIKCSKKNVFCNVPYGRRKDLARVINFAVPAIIVK
jgi:hypothetical protein